MKNTRLTTAVLCLFISQAVMASLPKSPLKPDNGIIDPPRVVAGGHGSTVLPIPGLPDNGIIDPPPVATFIPKPGSPDDNGIIDPPRFTSVPHWLDQWEKPILPKVKTVSYRVNDGSEAESILGLITYGPKEPVDDDDMNPEKGPLLAIDPMGVGPAKDWWEKGGLPVYAFTDDFTSQLLGWPNWRKLANITLAQNIRLNVEVAAGETLDATTELREFAKAILASDSPADVVAEDIEMAQIMKAVNTQSL